MSDTEASSLTTETSPIEDDHSEEALHTPEIEDKDWDEVDDTIQSIQESDALENHLITGDSDDVELSRDEIVIETPTQAEPREKASVMPTHLEDRHIEEIFEIVTQAKTLIARGKFSEARTQIIQ